MSYTFQPAARLLESVAVLDAVEGVHRGLHSVFNGGRSIANLGNLCILAPMRNAMTLTGILLLAVLISPLAKAVPGTAAVAMPDVHSAAASAAVLVEGGNAVDAAITAAFVLGVTFPEAGNIGGGGFMVSHMDGEGAFLDFREKAPLAAERDMFLDEDGNFVQRRSMVGPLGVGVPGTVRGMHMAHQRYGSLEWERLLEPAITLAAEGFEPHPQLLKYRDESLDKFGSDTNFADYFGPMEAGAPFKQPELAETLRRLAKDPDDFYRGRVAGQIIAQMNQTGGLFTAQDLAAYTAVWREPLYAPWRGHVLLSTAPPSSGGIALTQLLTIRDAINPLFRNVPHNTARYIHLLAEIEKRVFADRGDYLGDPDFGHVPVAELTDPAYLRRRAMEINAEAISAAESVKPGLESTDTTHFSIMDPEGNAVSLTYTLNWEFGSGVVVSGAGFLLNNEMDDFAAKAGVPNAFGVVGGNMNAIEPGKRMLSSMTPTILLRDDRPIMVVGSPGGSTIFTTVMQVILNVFDFDMNAQEAVNVTRFHHQLPASMEIRYDLHREIDPELRRRLETLGYSVVPNSWGDLGDAHLVMINDRGELEAASDTRGRGQALLIEVPLRAGAKAAP